MGGGGFSFSFRRPPPRGRALRGSPQAPEGAASPPHRPRRIDPRRRGGRWGTVSPPPAGDLRGAPRWISEIASSLSTSISLNRKLNLISTSALSPQEGGCRDHQEDQEDDDDGGEGGEEAEKVGRSKVRENAVAGRGETMSPIEMAPKDDNRGEKMADRASSSVGRRVDEAARHLLSNVLAMVVAWHDEAKPYKDFAYLGHVLGSIADFHLVAGNLTTVIVTNDAEATRAKLELAQRGSLIRIHEANLTGIHGFYLPFFHRDVVEAHMKGPNPPTAYAFFEEDTVTSAEGLLAWARDAAFLERNGRPDLVRHFYRWEWNEDKKCVAMNAQGYPVSRGNPDPPKKPSRREQKKKKGGEKGVAGWMRQPSTDIHRVGDRSFVALASGKWAGMYVVTARHMEEFRDSGTFWTRAARDQEARRHQLHAVVRKDGGFENVLAFKHEAGSAVVPLDRRGGRGLDVRAGVHHQSDKYSRTRIPNLGKLCVDDLFVD